MLLRFLCAFLTLLSIAFAQESRGTIAGRVTDPHDAGIPGARVLITNADTGVATSHVTNDKGIYSAPLLLPGKYQVAAEHDGFKRAAVKDVILSISDELQIDLRMELGSVSESITVTESAPVIEASNGSLGMLLGNKEMTELPVAQGNPYLLIALAPGTTFEGDPTLNRPYEPTHIVNYSMSGSLGGTTDITLEGVSNTSKGSGGGTVAAGYVPPLDAIGEMRVETSSFDARTGQSSGGVINISLRSGTNKVHGAVAYTNAQPAWFANNFFANRSGLPAGDFFYHRWSASLNGPVYIPHLYNGRNKTFFMWAYEGLRDERPRGGSTNLTVPTGGERQGDFSELLKIGATYQIYDPSTRRQQAGSTTRYQEDPFPGNIIPANRFNPIALNALTFFGMPIDQGTTADHRNNYPQPNLAEDAKYFTNTVRVDQNFASGDRFFVRANGYVRNTWRQDYFNSRATGLTEQYHPKGGSVDHVHTFGGSLVMNLRYGYTRFTRQTDPLHGRGFDLTSLGFPKSFNDSISQEFREFPVFNINGYFTTLNTGEARFMDTHSAVAAFTKLKGTHTFDFGFEYRAYRQNKYNGSSSRSGNFIFDTTWTRGPLDNSTAAPIGQGMAAFLLGLPNASSLVARNADYAEESTAWMGYVQDNWRLRRNVTVTIGVRYELEGPLTERYGRGIRDFDSTIVLPIEAAAKAAYAAGYAANPTRELPPAQFQVRGGLLFAGASGRDRELWNRDWNNLAPRIGLAWTLARNTVFRGGYGIFFGGLGLRRTDILQNGFERSTNMIPTIDNGLTFQATLSNPFPNGILEPVGSALGSMTDVGNSITFFDPNPKTNYNQRWQGSLQRQFGRSTVVEAAYVGNRATKLEVARDLNVVGNQNLSRSPFFDSTVVNYLTANIPNPFRGLPGVNGTLGSGTTVTRETILRPYPQFNAVNAETYQGYSWYHSLQLRTSRRLSRTTVNASYTWSKNMLANGFLNPGDTVPYRSLSGADRKHRITVAVTYPLPNVRTSKWLNQVIGGWQVSSIYIYQSGIPLGWGDVVFFGDSEDIGNGPHTVDQWFNVNSGFTRNTATRPASYHYRSWPFRFSDVRGPAMSNVDLSISKRWRLTERGTEFRVQADGLNAFNHPQFANPTTDQFSSAFGQITSTANYPRQVQATARLTW